MNFLRIIFIHCDITKYFNYGIKLWIILKIGEKSVENRLTIGFCQSRDARWNALHDDNCSTALTALWCHQIIYFSSASNIYLLLVIFSETFARISRNTSILLFCRFITKQLLSEFWSWVQWILVNNWGASIVEPDHWLEMILGSWKTPNSWFLINSHA